VLANALRRSEAKIVLPSYLLGGRSAAGRRRLCPRGRAGQSGGRRYAGQDALDADRRHALRLPPVGRATVSAFGLGPREQSGGDGSHAAAAWPTATIAPHFLLKDAKGTPYDIFAISGADQWYNVGAQRVRALQNDLTDRTFRSGYQRSVGAGWTSWAVESFMDEAAL
jgi:hypothetical protein